jgi:hypothetical protein
MSAFNATFFLEANADARGSGVPHPTLYVQPDGGRSGAINLQMKSGLSVDEQVKIAASILRGVQLWHDQLVKDAERRRTVEDELAAAREEIARLQAERNGGEGE